MLYPKAAASLAPSPRENHSKLLSRFLPLLRYRVTRRMRALRVDTSRVIITFENDVIAVRGHVQSRLDANTLLSVVYRESEAERVLDGLRVDDEPPLAYEYVALRGSAAKDAISKHFGTESKSE